MGSKPIQTTILAGISSFLFIEIYVVNYGHFYDS